MKVKEGLQVEQAGKEDKTGLKNAKHFYFGPVAANSSLSHPHLGRIVLGVQMQL